MRSRGIWDFCVKKGKQGGGSRGILCVCVCVCVWQHLYSDRASSLNLDVTACSLCHTGAGGGAEENTYKPVPLCPNQTPRHTHTHTHTHTHKYTVYPCQVKYCGMSGGPSGLQQPNVSSDINGCFSWLKGENTLKNHTSEQPLGFARDKLIDISDALLNMPAF